MVIFDKKDLRLGAISIAAVLSHMSFDIFLSGTTEFPVFVPLITKTLSFSGTDWLIFEFFAGLIIFISSIIYLKKQKNKIIQK